MREQVVLGLMIADEIAKEHGFNPRWTFENFVVGACNRMAYEKAQIVAVHPGSEINPLFIFGQVGLGKSHLMNAIGLSVLSRNPSAKIAFVTSDEFTCEFSNALRFNSLAAFRNKYRTPDFLLIDAVDYLAQKSKTQAELYQLVKAMYAGQKQIVAAACGSPPELTDFDEGLKSFFGCGEIVELGRPDRETRKAIVKKKAKEDGLALSDDVATFIAELFECDPMSLIGGLIRVKAYSESLGRPITTELAQECLADLITRP
jgi:chromosomal replication initiator protein